MANPDTGIDEARAQEVDMLVAKLVALIFRGLQNKSWLYWPPGPMTGQVFDKEACARDVRALIDDLITAVRSEAHAQCWQPSDKTMQDALNEVCREVLGSMQVAFPEIPPRKLIFILEGYRDALVMAFTDLPRIDPKENG